MTFSDSGKIPTRVIVIQLVFLVVVAGVFAFVKIYSPRMEKERAARQLAERESRITDFFNSMVAEDSGRQVETLRGQMHPQTLRSTPSVDDLQQTLGASQQNVSKHLGVLVAENIVGRRKDGNHAYYRIVDDGVLGLCEQVCGSLEQQAQTLALIVGGAGSV